MVKTERNIVENTFFDNKYCSIYTYINNYYYLCATLKTRFH